MATAQRLLSRRSPAGAFRSPQKTSACRSVRIPACHASSNQCGSTPTLARDRCRSSVRSFIRSGANRLASHSASTTDVLVFRRGFVVRRLCIRKIFAARARFWDKPMMGRSGANPGARTFLLRRFIRGLENPRSIPRLNHGIAASCCRGRPVRERHTDEKDLDRFPVPPV